MIGARVRSFWGYLFVAGQLCGCSFIAEPVPGTAHELRPKDGYRCGRSFWLPIADTASTVASVTWVVRANNELEVHENDQDTDKWSVVRVAGWTGIALFGASAIYGYVVEGRCAKLRSDAEASAAPPPPTVRPAFPGSVLGFGFSMQAGELAQLCLSKGQLWTTEGATGSCKPKLASGTTPEVRVLFELGVPSEIRTLYVGAAETKNRDYQALAAGLRANYGPPQVEPQAWPAACQTSLAACLEAGVRPKGPVWHWPAGTIELVPSWASERAVLDIRYTREEVRGP